MMWQIEINWGGQWHVMKTGYKSRDDAEWDTAGWKQANKCMGDPFRSVQVPDPRAEPVKTVNERLTELIGYPPVN